MLTQKTVTRGRSIRDFMLSYHHRTALALTIFLVVFLPHSVQANDFQGCSDCHKEALDIDSKQTYLHSSFIQKQCEACHVPKLSASAQKSLKKRGLLTGLNFQHRIYWLADTTMKDTSHGFLLSNDKLGEILIVELCGTDGKYSLHEIAIPSLTDLSEIEDSGKPPTISKVQVLKVHQGVFTSVTIGWQTNTLADSLIRYGINNLSKKSNFNKRLGRQHQVVLSNLKPKETYRFTAVSQDLFGRREVSEPLTFSTSTPLTMTQSDNSGNLPAGNGDAGISSLFQRYGTDYLLDLTLEQPSSVNIGSKGDAFGRNKSHTGLSRDAMLYIQTCFNCHNGSDVCDHPVKVKPTKKGLFIPPEYPTLPNGQITCISCHAPHSSHNQFLTRKHYKQELCVSCHLKWKFTKKKRK